MSTWARSEARAPGDAARCEAQDMRKGSRGHHSELSGASDIACPEAQCTKQVLCSDEAGADRNMQQHYASTHCKSQAFRLSLRLSFEHTCAASDFLLDLHQSETQSPVLAVGGSSAARACSYGHIWCQQLCLVHGSVTPESLDYTKFPTCSAALGLE